MSQSKHHTIPAIQIYGLLLVFFAIGLAIRVWLSTQHPVWLDEQYSLLFAWTRSPAELLIHNQDVHPGMYYLLLKGLLVFSRDVLTLRMFSSMLPQTLAAVGIGVWMLRKKYSALTALLTSALLLANPFLIYLGIQIRMYGFVSCLAVCVFVALKEWKLQPRSWKHRLLLLTLLALGNSFSYSFFFLTGGCLVYLFWEEYGRKRQFPLWVVLAGVIFLFEFLLLAGTNVKHQFEQASWIPLPSIVNISSLFLTVTGIESDHFLVRSTVELSDAIFYSTVLIVSWFSYVQSRAKKYCITSPVVRQIICLVLLPMITIVTSSMLMPVLSQHFFFYQFVPKLSLFLPRVFTPFVVVGSCLVAEGIGKWFPKQVLTVRSVTVALGILLLGLWIHSTVEILSIAAKFQQVETFNQQLFQLADQFRSKSGQETYYLPSWVLMSKVTPSSLDNIHQVQQEIQSSADLENFLLETPQPSCAQFTHIQVIYTGVASTIQKFYEPVLQTLDHCCISQNLFGNAKSWQCPAS